MDRDLHDVRDLLKEKHERSMWEAEMRYAFPGCVILTPQECARHAEAGRDLHQQLDYFFSIDDGDFDVW